MKKTITLLLCMTVCASFANSPYISRVFEYCPAPGQFINTLPKYEAGADATSMARKAEDCLKDNNQTMICLGAFGGYVTFGFDHSIINIPGEYDFQVLGNAFYANANPNPNARPGGSSEPGIVMVSKDGNHNGLPDDPWYELAGSHYDSEGTIHHYEITYYRPDTLTQDVLWKDNQGQTGYVKRNAYHRQAYYPEWYGDSITFRGTCLPTNAVDESGNGSYYVLYCFDWGYVDNRPNTEKDANSFKIDWAVDEDGQHVALSSIDFVRVYTAINQMAGQLGETSTEVLDAMDLHPDEHTELEKTTTTTILSKMLYQGQIQIRRGQDIYDILGRKIN